METEVTASGISFNLRQTIMQLQNKEKGNSVTAKAIVTRGGSVNNPYNINYLSTWDNSGLAHNVLGDWQGEYLITPQIADMPEGLLNRIEHVILPGIDNSQYAKPTAEVNIDVLMDTRLNLVFLDEMAAWRNAIGYYYYDKDNAPKSQAEFDALPKYIALPNCSAYDWNGTGTGDVIWGNGGYYCAPLFSGEQIKLIYFGQDGKQSEVFPKGTTIGWFILPDGYEVSNSGNGKLNITGSKHAALYSNNEFNPGNACYLVNLYDKASDKIVLGFEDSGDGSYGDYKDVLFYVDASQTGAIGTGSNKPSIDPDDEKYPDVTGDPQQGTWAFEDLWPSQGDYDLNDVVIGYSTTFTTDKDNKIVSVKDVFTPLHNGGSIQNAFGYQLDIPATAVKNVQIENGTSSAQAVGGLESGQAKAVIMLFDDNRQAPSKGAITVTVELDGSVSMDRVTRRSLYNPFICRTDNGFEPGAVRKEIHLTNYPPTSLADPYPFGRNDDKSSVDKGGNPTGPYYYVTSDLHPFAIDLPITDYRIPDESVKIDDFYPEFAGWVTSKGEKNKNWYLKPRK